MVVNHENRLVENITRLMKCDSFNDVRIRLSNDVQVEANKVILSAMSTFFHKELREKLTSANDGKLLEVDVQTSSTKELLELVIKYFYTGKMNFESLPLKDLLYLLDLLFHLDLHVLFTLVEEFIIKKIKKGGFPLEELLILSSTAENNEYQDIVSNMISYLRLNIRDVSKLPEVKCMSFQFLENLLFDTDEFVEKFDNDSAFLLPRFETVSSWIASNNVDEEAEVTPLISMFDLEKFTVHQLTSTVRESKLFSESSILDVLGKASIELQEKVRILEVHASINEASIIGLKKNVEVLQDTVESKNQRITSINEKLNKANEEANKAIQELDLATLNVRKLEKEKFLLELDVDNLSLGLSRGRK